MTPLIIIPVLGVLAILGILLYFYFKRMAAFLNIRIEKKSKKAIIIILSTALIIFCINIYSMTAIIILHIIFISLFMQFMNFIIVSISSYKKKELKKWNRLYLSGIIPLIVTMILMIYGYYNMNNIVEKDYEVSTEKDIQEQGYRIGFIADLHFGVSINEEQLKETVKEISSKDIDVLILGGDITDENTTLSQMESVYSILGETKTKYGIYFVYGNHDRQPYSGEKKYTEEQLDNAIAGAGISILSDESSVINDELTIIGREDASFDGSSNRKTLEELMAGVDKNDYIVVIDHRPVEYKENEEEKTDLILSGHTHAGQIWPANILFEFVKFDDGVYGVYDMGETKAIVTAGIAGWGYPVKTSEHAEYVIVNVDKAE